MELLFALRLSLSASYQNRPSSTRELVTKIKNDYTIIIVTHNMQQALRVSDYTAFFLVGEMVEYATTKSLFSYPQDKRTEDYITGRFG